MDRQTMLLCRFNQSLAKKPIIRVRGKDYLPVVVTLDEVLWLAGDDLSGKTGHGGLWNGEIA
jgi:hypothetical protein